MLATESLTVLYLVPMTACFFRLQCLFHVGFSLVGTGDFPGRVRVNCKSSCLMLVHIKIRKTKILSYPCNPPALFIFVKHSIVWYSRHSMEL